MYNCVGRTVQLFQSGAVSGAGSRTTAEPSSCCPERAGDHLVAVAVGVCGVHRPFLDFGVHSQTPAAACSSGAGMCAVPAAPCVGLCS